MALTMKARITAEMVVGRGLILQTGDEVDVEVFGDFAEFLLRDSAIVLVEPILAAVDPPQSDNPVRLI